MADTNELFDKVRSDFQAAIDREVQIRTNYEQGLIPTLERDLQAARKDVHDLTVEVEYLRGWKARACTAWAMIERAHVLTEEAISAAPTETVPSAPPVGDEALPPSWRAAGG